MKRRLSSTVVVHSAYTVKARIDRNEERKAAWWVVKRVAYVLALMALGAAAVYVAGWVAGVGR